MKYTIIALLIITGALRSNGQVQYQDSLHHITATGYIGALGGPKISTLSEQKALIVGFITLRTGGTVQWDANRYVTLYGLAAAEIDQTATITPFSLLFIRITPYKKITITIGKIATTMTELRPLPTTGAGQFEPWTRAQIPGSALGAKIRYSFNQSFSLVASGAWRTTDASIELGFQAPYTQIAGYYLSQSHLFGAAVNFDYSYISTTIVYNQNKTMGDLIIFEIPKTKGWKLYSDIGFNTSWKLIRGEWGTLKDFKVWKIQSLLGAGYSQETRSVKGYIFIHI